MRRRWTLALAALTLVGLGTLSGCGGSISIGGTPTVPQATLESSVNTKAEAQFGPELTTSCGGDLTGKTGDTQTCTVTDTEGNTVDLLVTVTTVDGQEVNFNITSVEE